MGEVWRLQHVPLFWSSFLADETGAIPWLVPTCFAQVSFLFWTLFLLRRPPLPLFKEEDRGEEISSAPVSNFKSTVVSVVLVAVAFAAFVSGFISSSDDVPTIVFEFFSGNFQFSEDKSNTYVILDELDYDRKLQHFIHNRSKCTELNKNTTDTLKKSENKLTKINNTDIGSLKINKTFGDY